MNLFNSNKEVDYNEAKQRLVAAKGDLYTAIETFLDEHN